MRVFLNHIKVQLKRRNPLIYVYIYIHTHMHKANMQHEKIDQTLPTFLGYGLSEVQEKVKINHCHTQGTWPKQGIGKINQTLPTS